MGKKPFENIVGKGENADNQHLLHFPQCLLSYQRKLAHICATLKLLSANAFNLDKGKILSSDKGIDSRNMRKCPSLQMRTCKTDKTIIQIIP